MTEAKPRSWADVAYVFARWTIPAVLAALGVGGLNYASNQHTKESSDKGLSVLAKASNEVQVTLESLNSQVDQLEGHVRLMNQVLVAHVYPATNAVPPAVKPPRPHAAKPPTVAVAPTTQPASQPTWKRLEDMTKAMAKPKAPRKLFKARMLPEKF